MVPLAQSLVQIFLGLVGSKRISLVQVRQYPDGILLGAKVGKDPVELLLHIERPDLNLVTVEGHQIGLHAKGTRLVQTSAAARRAELAQIGNVHLAQCIQVEMI